MLYSSQSDWLVSGLEMERYDELLDDTSSLSELLKCLALN